MIGQLILGLNLSVSSTSYWCSIGPMETQKSVRLAVVRKMRFPTKVTFAVALFRNY